MMLAQRPCIIGWPGQREASFRRFRRMCSELRMHLAPVQAASDFTASSAVTNSTEP